MRLLRTTGMAVCVALLCSVVTVSPAGVASAGGNGWRWLNPKPTGDGLNAVSMSPTTGSSCMWAVGNYGFIAKTFDYGASWHEFTPAGITGNPDLLDIDLVSDSVGWAVGANGTIVKISEGWQTAVQAAPEGTGHLYAVDAWSATTACAVGQDGVVIKTADGGTTWTTVLAAATPGYSTWNAVTCLDATRFWVAGTGNGGATNNDLFFFDGSFFYNKSTGDVTFHAQDLFVEPATYTLWVVGSNDTPGGPKHYQVTGDSDIASPASGGLFYAEAAPMPTVGGGLTSISRPDATHTWITTSQGEVLFYDGVGPWAEQSHPYGGTWLNDIDFRIDSGQYRGVYVAGGGVMGITANAGTTWTKRPSSKLCDPIMGIDFVSTTTGYVTQGANASKTVDSGNTWSPLPAAPGSPLLDLDFLSTGKGWAVGRSGTAVFFDGTTWSALDSGLSPGRDLHSVCYVDTANIWACGDIGTIANSTGTSWTMSVDPDVTTGLWRSIDFFGTQNGIAVGDGGAVVHTSDGGTTWDAGDSGVVENIYSVDMVSATVGFLVGDNAGAAMTMKKTTDGGATWTTLTAPAGLSWTDLSAVSFADANNGWIVGAGGTILHTTNGAAGTPTWTKQNMSAEWFNSISAVSPSAAWAGGGNGALITSYVAPPKTVVYRLYNMKNGSHFYTSSYEEKVHILKTWPDIYKYEGVGYEYDGSKATAPLYRLYNKVSGSHFYTTSWAEAENAVKKWPTVFTYEGPAFNVSSAPVPAGGTVFRFYNLKNGSHFFTADPAERDMVIAKWPNVFSYEGPAYYLPQ